MANAQATPDHLSGQLERICSFIKLLNGSNIVPIAYVVLMKQKGNKIVAEPTLREKQVTNFFIAIWATQNL